MKARKLVAMATRVKDAAFERDPSDPGVSPIVLFERDGGITAMVFCPQADPVWAAKALRSGIPGFDASGAALVSDAFGLTGENDEFERGFYWGEFQDRWNRGEREGMTEAMSVVGGHRGSRKILHISRPYVHDPDKGVIVWDDPQISTSEWRPGERHGRMPRMIAEGFAQSSSLEDHGVDYRDFGLSREEARIHADCGQMRALLALGYHVALRREPGLRDEIIDQTMKNIEAEGLFDPDLLRETLARYDAGEFL